MILGAVRRDFSCRWAVWPSRLALLSRGIVFCFLLLIPFLRGSAVENKACGELFHPEALRRVRTVCVDTSYLEAGVASDVKTFVAREKQPGQLLKLMTWEFTDQCAAADAFIRVYFAPSERHVTESDYSLRGGGTSRDFYEPVTQVVLLVYDRASVRLLYRTEAQGQATNRVALLKGPFAKLVKDIKELSH